MATEEKIDTMKSFDFAMKSIAEIGVSQINLVSDTVKSITPVITNAAEQTGKTISASLNTLGTSAGEVTGALSTFGNSVIDLAGTISSAVVSVAGSLTDSILKATGNNGSC